VGSSIAGPVGGRRVIGYDATVGAAVGLWLRTGTIDMDALARRMAVSRATLYRVVPGRDRLLGDVLWRQAGVLFARARRDARGAGADRVLDVLRRFGEDIVSAQPFRQFIRAEPDTAIRVLFTPAGAVHERFVALNRDLLAEEAAAGTLVPPFDLDDLAYVFVRVYESMWYADLLAGREPNLRVADCAARAMLRAATPPADG